MPGNTKNNVNNTQYSLLFELPPQQEPFNGQNTNFPGGGYSYSQGSGVRMHFLSLEENVHFQQAMFVYCNSADVFIVAILLLSLAPKAW